MRSRAEVVHRAARRQDSGDSQEKSERLSDDHDFGKLSNGRHNGRRHRLSGKGYLASRTTRHGDALAPPGVPALSEPLTRVQSGRRP